MIRLATFWASERVETALVPKVHIWCVAPTYSLLDEPWRLLRTIAPKELVVRTNETSRTVELVGDVIIEFKSADTPERLVGAGLDLLVLYEAALIPELAWTQSLRPRLASPGRAGLMIGGGTPKGRNWWHRIYLDGQDPAKPDVWSLSQPTGANPLIDPAEVEAMRREMPDRAFRQEVLAEFLDDAGGVFRGVRECIVPARGRQGAVTIGIDWGFTQDFTVCLALDETGYVCALDRWNNATWRTTVNRVLEFIDQQSPVERVVVECTRADSAVVENLQDELHMRGNKVPVLPFKTAAANKRNLIESLAMALERRWIAYPELPVLINELELYSFVVGPNGEPRYSAPKGARYHDDCVMALALALHGVAESVAKQQYAYAAVVGFEDAFEAGSSWWRAPRPLPVDTRHHTERY
jgi:hypothetical protein